MPAYKLSFSSYKNFFLFALQIGYERMYTKAND